MKRLALALVLLAGLASATPAHAAKPGLPITLGEHSRQVCDALHLQRSYAPSHFAGNSYFRVRKDALPKACKGRHPQAVYRLKDAQRTWLLKYRLGYSPRQLKFHGRVFGGDLRNLLLGRSVRTQEQMKFWGKRRHDFLYPPKRCDIGDRIVLVALSKLGAGESWGNNWGPSVREFQAVTGAYHAAWCVSFAQWVYLHAGAGTFANRSAAVYTVLGWAQQQDRYGNAVTWSRTQHPHRGDIAIFHTWQGHMGVVDTVTKGGWYSVEGNASNTVLRRFHCWGCRNVSFVHIRATEHRIVCPGTRTNSRSIVYLPATRKKVAA